MTVNQLSGCDTRQLWTIPLTLSVINVEISYKEKTISPGCYQVVMLQLKLCL